MTQDDSRVDRDGNIYGKNWAGNYEPRWDSWNQRVEHDSSDREYYPDAYAGDGTPLYRRKYPASAPSSGGDGGLESAAAFGILALVAGFAFAIFKGIAYAINTYVRPNQTIQYTYKDPGTATVLSLVTCGCGGYYYLGQRKKGLTTAIAFLLLTPIGVGLLIPPLAAIDTYRTAVKLQQGQPVGEWEFSLGGDWGFKQGGEWEFGVEDKYIPTIRAICIVLSILLIMAFIIIACIYTGAIFMYST